MPDVFLCVLSGVIKVNKFDVRLLPSTHLIYDNFQGSHICTHYT